MAPIKKRRRKPTHGRINKDGSVVDEGLPGWAIERLFKLQAELETAMPWQRAAIEREIEQIKKAT